MAKKQYEISNHLGDVLVTITDEKYAYAPFGTANNGFIATYFAQYKKSSDYTAFGAPLESRQALVYGEYRYGFQGQENDDELLEGAVTFKYRIEDPRLGRFFSVDPLSPEYPWNSAYAFSENRVIDAKEQEGLECALITYQFRITPILLTGSFSIGAGVEINGDVKIFYTWSGGLGFGLYAGGGLGVVIYPTATIGQAMGHGSSAGFNVGVPGVNLSGEINASIQQDEFTGDVNGLKLGFTIPLELGNIGPGGAELHWDYSYTTEIPELSFNLSEIPSQLRNQINSIYEMSDTEYESFISGIKIAANELNGQGS